MRILLADDDRLLREYIENAVPESFGGQLDMAATAAEAIGMIRQNQYDKAVIDLYFDGEELSGFDILKEAVEREIQERIVFTSVSNQMDLLKAGATAAFRKPLSVKKIAQFLLTSDYDLLREGELF